VSFTPADDMWQESDETIIVSISTGAYNIGSPSSATLTIHDNDHSPTDISLSNSSVAENQSSGATVGNLSTTDGDAGDTFTYSLVSGTGSADNSSFAISGNHLNTAASFDYETKNSYSVRVRSTDAAGHTVEKAFTISVTNVNEAPVITSNGGGSTASVSIAKNTTAVTTVTATDPDAGAALSYSKSGGADSSQFSINCSTGVLTFTSAPDFDSPTDANGDNVYVVDVQASDGSLTDVQTISVTVTNVNEAPVITSNGGGSAASVSIAENRGNDRHRYRSRCRHVALTVNFVLSGDAENGVDYEELDSSVTFAATEAHAWVTITPIADGVIDDDESVILTLTSTSSLACEVSTTALSDTLTITDGTEEIDWWITGHTETEPASDLPGDATATGFTLHLSSPVADNVYFLLSIDGGDATEVDDYSLPADMMAMVFAGADSADFSIPIAFDLLAEDTENIEASAVPGDYSQSGSGWFLSSTSSQSATAYIDDNGLHDSYLHLDLDNDADNNGAIDEMDDPIEATTPGRSMCVNSDDDDGDSTTDSAETGPIDGEDDLEELDIHFAAASAYDCMTLTLSTDSGTASSVAMWTTADKGTGLTMS
jgi:hypothetical protein